MDEITVNDHTVDIDELASHTQERLRSYAKGRDQHGKKPLIYRVPKEFHEIDGSDYVPRCCSIGPYHNGAEWLQSMEMQKLNCLAIICKHFPAATIEQYYEKLLPLEEEARRYYFGNIPMNTTRFLEMLLLDSCFILANFRILDLHDPANSIRNNSNTESNSMRDNVENCGAQNSNQRNPGFIGEENSDQLNNIRTSKARSDEINPADSGCDSSNTGSNSQQNSEENHGVPNPNGSNHGFAGEENSDQNNIQISRARSNEISPADPIHDSSNTGSNYQENNRENLGAENPNGTNIGFAGEENSDQTNIKTSSARSDECNPFSSSVRDFEHDLLLFENQIPFFIIQKIYNVASGHKTPNEHVVASKLGKILKEHILIPKTAEKNDYPKKIYHLLHFFHWLLRPSEEQNECSTVDSSLIKQLRLWLQVIRKLLAEKWKCQTNKNQQQEQLKRWRRAAEYHEAGVHFKISPQPSYSLLDIEFVKGELRIPKLIIDENTSYIFGNLLAFEQETAQFGSHITKYITFMSQLLSMPEDVTLLSRKGIIEHHLGCDEDVSELFKNLSKLRFLQLATSGYLKAVWDGLEKHYQNHWNRWFAWLRHKHMKNPWLILGLLVAAIVAICAVVQAFCSLVDVNRKNAKGT